MGKGLAGRWEENQERGIKKASGGEQICWAWGLGSLDGGFSIILEGLGASPFSSLDHSFPSVNWSWSHECSVPAFED